MSDIAIQASFNSGEWAPALRARVDIAQYKSGAALLENWIVDYRGGASTRTGTEYILQARLSQYAVRLISFQLTFDLGYTLEFGQNYIRFFYRGSPILEDAAAITGASQANPAGITIPGNTYAAGDWLYVSSVGGMTQLNGRFFIVSSVVGDNVFLADLNADPINSTGYNAYTSGGQAQRVYTISSPYIGDELALVKFAQNVKDMVLCHPNHPPYVLSIITATNWSLVPAVIGSTSVAPVGLVYNTTLGFGPVTYTYGVTSIDANGQESSMSAPVSSSDQREDIRVINGSNKIDWDPVPGAFGYNIYEATVSYFGAAPVGVQFGFIGTTRGREFIDSNISPDFSQTPPLSQDPFSGSGVQFLTLTTNDNYGLVPTVTLAGGSPSIPASARAVLGIKPNPTISVGGTSYNVGDRIVYTEGIQLRVNAVSSGAVTGVDIISAGRHTSGSVPGNPLSQVSTSGSGTGATISPLWQISGLEVLAEGAGYASAPTVVFSTGAAAATATLGPSSAGNPTVPGFFQQRLVFAAQPGAPQTFYLSKPGTNFNFDISSPSQPDDAITGTLVSGVLNTIKHMVSSSSGLLFLTDRAAWLVNGGSPGSAVSPSAIVANAQSFVGCSDVPPIVANYDILYVQSKGAAVRDLAFNIYFNTFTGEDISVISSHLFYNHTINEWAWAEQPFYIAWAVRDDGRMLTLTFLKEQQYKAWCHHNSPGGAFKSVASVTEPTNTAGVVDAVYTVVERVVNTRTVKYIERFAERAFPNGVVDAWCVDSGQQFNGSPTSSFVGCEHLAGLTVTGLADGQPITPFVMPTSGQFTLPVAASKVTIGIGYNCDLQTLPLQLEGQEAVQGKAKKLPFVDVRVNDALGLSIGSDFTHLTPMKDLIRGKVSSMLAGQSNQIVTDLVSGDARTFLDPTYTTPGQFCIRQSQPYPATVLGLFPSYVIGDDR